MESVAPSELQLHPELNVASATGAQAFRIGLSARDGGIALHVDILSGIIISTARESIHHRPRRMVEGVQHLGLEIQPQLLEDGKHPDYREGFELYLERSS